MTHIVVTGGTGFVGRRLVQKLVAREGTRVTVLSRTEGDPRVPSGAQSRRWTPTSKGPWCDDVASADVVIHLAGEPVLGGRWTPDRKKRIHESRVESARLIVEAMKGAAKAPGAFLCASAVGFYGPRRPDEQLDESSPAGNDFLAHVCRTWEATADEATSLGVRVVRLRYGIIFGDEAGALAQMLPAFRFGVGGPVGSGEQIMSWVHADDAVALTLFALDHEAIKGPLNVTAPNAASMAELARALGRVLRRPSIMRVPSFVLKAALGEASSALLTGQRVLPKLALDQGYQFLFPTLDGALADLLGRPP